jgi:hypothetical protein
MMRGRFKSATTAMHSCLISNDPSTGVRGVPNCSFVYKHAETPYVEYEFNSCGNRDGAGCGAKAPGVYRIVLLGSSYAMGLGVAQESIFAALLPAEIRRKTGRNVEVYNAGMIYGVPHAVALQFNRTVALHPDLILWVITPWDIETTDLGLLVDGASRPEITSLRSFGWSAPIMHFVDSHLYGTKFALLHYFYLSSDFYMKSYLLGKDSEYGYLRSTPSQFWREKLYDFEGFASEIESRAGVAHIPIVVALLPDRPMLDLAAKNALPSGSDPFMLDHELKSIITRHGGTYADILPQFSGMQNPAQFYFPIDNHPDPEGHAILSRLLAAQLTNGAIPALRIVSETDTCRKKGQ